MADKKDAHNHEVETEDVQIEGYIHAFKESSDRSRRMIFIVVTVCVLIFIASWNLHQASWARTRMRKAAALRATQVAAKPAEATKQKPVQPPMDPKTAYNHLVIEKYPEEYVKQMLVIHLPAVGISTDVNEIGLLGGITLTLLMCILLVSLVRQHENLYLSIFKIRRLYENGGRMPHGENAANFLYHSLAMSQLLIAPPTLARWANSRVNLFSKAAFLIPATLQTYVVATNWMSPVPGFYDTDPRIKLLVQGAFAVALLVLGILCVIHVRAMDKRWRGTFFMINPEHRVMDPTPWLIWMKIRSRWSSREKWLRGELEDRLLRREGTVPSLGDSAYRFMMHARVRESSLTKRNVASVSHLLMKDARAQALDWCRANSHSFGELDGFVIVKMQREGKLIVVTIEWSARCSKVLRVNPEEKKTAAGAPATETAG